MTKASGPLKNIRVIDLTRVLAGPICTQMLGDMGADVIKIERPGEGDDSRRWGPPFLKDAAGNDTTESAYYLCANRNKRSIALDLANPDDLNSLHTLLRDADILIENFKPGSLARFGLSYNDVKTRYPRLICCSITGYGQTGPLSADAGYDFIIQGLSGFMSVTGAIDGPPAKAGVAVIDYITGQNATIGILAALNHRATSGHGQHIDIALFDSALALMTNIAQYTLVSGENPPRVGNAHTTIVPYNAFEATDKWIILTIGNDRQFEKFCTFAGHPEWSRDERFAKNHSRVANRTDIIALMSSAISTQPAAHWIEGLNAQGIPCGPVNTMAEALGMPQTKARDMVIAMDHPTTNKPVHLLGSPLKFSATPVNYRHAPPTLAQHQHEILGDDQ